MNASLDERTLEVRSHIEDAELAFGVIVAPVTGHPEEEGIQVAAVNPEPLSKPPHDREVDRIESRRGIWMGFWPCHSFSHTEYAAEITSRPLSHVTVIRQGKSQRVEAASGFRPVGSGTDSN